MPVTKKIRCHVENIVSYGHNVFTISLIPEKKMPRFLPGQFLHLALDEYDYSGFWPESRVFSIAQYSKVENLLSISYSVKGFFTTRMKNELEIDKKLWIKLPYGEFVIRDESDVVFVAGGTGITAFTAFIHSINETFTHKIYLAYGVRTKQQFIYKDSIDKIGKKFPNFFPIYFIEKNGDIDGLDKNINDGLISIEKLWEKIEQPKQSAYYLAGPPNMISSIRKSLLGKGLAESAINIDAWE